MVAMSEHRPRKPHASRRYGASSRMPAPEAWPVGWGSYAWGAVGLGLFLAWILQFATSVCDRHPGLTTFLAVCNAGLALLAGTLAWRDGVDRRWVGAGTATVVVGAGLVLAIQASYRGTLDGAPGYTLPHRPLAYGSQAQDVALTAADGTGLRGTFLGGKSGHGIVILPGWATTRHGFAIASLAQWLAPRFDVLALDPRGTGDSGGSLSPDLKGRYDVLAAIAFLSSHGDSAIGVLAEREAALPTLAALGAAQNLRSVVLAAPGARWGEAPLPGSWLMDPSHLLGRLYWRLGAGVRIAGGRGPETADLLARRSGVPILLVGSREDPRGILRQLHMIAPEPRSLRLFNLPGTPLAWGDYQAYYQTVSQWFDLTLAELESKATVGTPSIPVPEVATVSPPASDGSTP